MRSEYGFGGRLAAGFPSQIVVDATETCNLACLHCPHTDFRRSPHYSARHLDPDLNTRLVDEVARDGRGITQYIRYTSNGEPLLHPHLVDMLAYAKQRSGVTVALTTNGTRLTDSSIERLLSTGVDLIDISMDALRPQTYARIRKGGDLAVTESNVLRLIEKARTSRAGTRIVVSFVEQPLNTAETAEFEAFWKSRGAHSVVIRRLHTHCGAAGGAVQLAAAAGSAKPRRPCLYPWERILLNPRGELAFCPSDWVHGSVIADYRHTTIGETWQGEFYRRLRGAHLDNDYRAHAFCGACPDWQHTRWPHEGRSYADMIEEFQHAC